jgi:cellulose synthase/poly-beta-1,6-N-acetylglucosamine synthase-like glycosyltransferase
MNLFQKYVAIVEESCYHVDFEGRQVLGHPILFSGCCAMFRLDAVSAVGGFTSGHLTEDMDITDRLWLAGWKGVYLSSVVNYGEVPFSYDHYRRQQERWAAGSARALRDFIWPLITTERLNWFEKLSALRQNAYFVASLLSAFAILLGIATIAWINLAWNSYAVEYYLYLLGQVKTVFVVLIYWCILSNFVEPGIMIVAKRKTYRDLLHLPMTIWYAWGVLPAYLIGNLKGLFNIKLDWFCTPKFLRNHVTELARLPLSVRVMNGAVCSALLVFYFVQGWSFGWFDEFALLLVPAFLLASVK